MNNNANNNTEKIRKVLFNEISFILALIGSVLSLFIFFNSPITEQKITTEILKEQLNYQAKTIEQLSKSQYNDLHEIKKDLGEIKTSLKDLEIRVTRIETRLNEIKK